MNSPERYRYISSFLLNSSVTLVVIERELTILDPSQNILRISSTIALLDLYGREVLIFSSSLGFLDLFGHYILNTKDYVYLVYGYIYGMLFSSVLVDFYE